MLLVKFFEHRFVDDKLLVAIDQKLYCLENRQGYGRDIANKGDEIFQIVSIELNVLALRYYHIKEAIQRNIVQVVLKTVA